MEENKVKEAPVEFEEVDDRKVKELEFHQNRIMFYFDDKTGNIVFPKKKHQALSHADWFKAIGVDINKVTRGYFHDNGRHCMCYVGKAFEVPNITLEQLEVLKYLFQPWDIFLGAVPAAIGERWKGIKCISIYDL